MDLHYLISISPSCNLIDRLSKQKHDQFVAHLESWFAHSLDALYSSLAPRQCFCVLKNKSFPKSCVLKLKWKEKCDREMFFDKVTNIAPMIEILTS